MVVCRFAVENFVKRYLCGRLDTTGSILYRPTISRKGKREETGSGKMGRKRRERQRTGAGKGKEQGDGSEGEERGMREGGILN